MITYEVEGLYSNVTHNLGWAAINYWLEKYALILDDFTK